MATSGAAAAAALTCATIATRTAESITCASVAAAGLAEMAASGTAPASSAHRVASACAAYVRGVPCRLVASDTHGDGFCDVHSPATLVAQHATARARARAALARDALAAALMARNPRPTAGQTPQGALAATRRTFRAAPVMHVVLDLDETLVALDPDAPPELLDMHAVSVDGEAAALQIALRPWARRFLFHLAAAGFRVYVLTAGSQEYCDALVSLLNVLCAFEGASDPVIVYGASCRDEDDGHVRRKALEMVLLDHQRALALAVDNRRDAWVRAERDQVVIVADYEPAYTRGQSESVLVQVLEVLLTVAATIERGFADTGLYAHAGEVLQALYDRKLRAIETERTASFAFSHPDPRVADPDGFLAFLATHRR